MAHSSTSSSNGRFPSTGGRNNNNSSNNSKASGRNSEGGVGSSGLYNPDDGLGTKSCLAFKNPLLFGKRKKGTNNSAAGATSLSTVSEDKWFTTNNSIAANNNNNNNVNNVNNYWNTPRRSDSDNSSNYNNNLFALPTPEDRTSDRRSYENKRRGLYEGEIEPEGVRGQEAAIINTNYIAPKLGSNNNNTSSSINIIRSQTHPSNNNKLMIVPEVSHESNSYYENNNEQQREQEQQQEQQDDDIIINNLHSVSTCSDDDIQNMLPDFLKSTDSTTPPNLLHSPSAIKDDNNNNKNKTTTTTKTVITPTNNEQQQQQTTTTASKISLPSLNTNHDDFNNEPLLLRPQHKPMIVTPQQQVENSILSFNNNHNQHNNDNNNNNEIVTTDDCKDIEVLQQRAMEYVQSNQLELALHYFSRVLYIQLDKFGKNHPNTASAYHNLGTVHAKRATTTTTLNESDNSNNNTDTLQQRHSRTAALECFQAAARSARDSLGPNHPNVAVSLVRVGFLLLQSKQYKNAIITFQEALRIRIAAFTEIHSLVANLYNNLGVCSMHMGNFIQGSEYLYKALTIQRNLSTNNDNDNNDSNSNNNKAIQLEMADTLFNIGGLCLECIRRQGPDARQAIQAEEAFYEALQIRTRILGPNDPMVQQVQGLYDIARTIPRPAISSAKKRSNIPRPTTPSRQRRLEAQRRNILSSPQQQSSGIARTITATSSSEGLLAPPELLRKRSSPQNNQRTDAPDTSQDSIFRRALPERIKNKSSPHRAPVLQITVSKDNASDVMDYDDDNLENNNNNNTTRIYIAPHLIPQPMSSSKQRNSLNESDEALVGNSYIENDDFKLDTSVDQYNNNNNENKKTSIINKVTLPDMSYSYDGEESCLINDSGVDSGHGRIHYPLAWTKAKIKLTNDETQDDSNSHKRDIMVTRPIRGTIQGTTTDNSIPPLDSLKRNSNVGLYGSASSGQWGSETVNFSTGNKDRDEIMNKARAILEAHANPNRVLSSEESDNNNNDQQQQLLVRDFEHDPVEEGIAPLGGYWGPSAEKKTTSTNKRLSVNEMLRDPTNYLKEIHNEATKQLQKNNIIDSLHLFDIVLQCQRHRHGPLHPDVAAALHNIGIVQLRGNTNLNEALKAFEEAARVRKGSLGKDHPLVAVSLVKVGITLLLLHRFDDALWSFREALSVRKHSLGALHPSTARVYNNIGCVHVEFNEFKEARRAFEAALDIQRSSLCHDPESSPLMFATATTLCNLGYLYRYRDMHAKAAAVLSEATDLQEKVLGKSHPTVLSTIDNLADSCANSSNSSDALKYYNEVLGRFRSAGKREGQKHYRAEAVLLYKMSRVHRQRKDRESQLDALKLALQSIRQYPGNLPGRMDTLERRIQYDIRACREELEKEQLKWI